MMFRDTFEPKNIEDLIAQSVPIQKKNLNHALGIADYLWFTCDGHRVQVERKQFDEILSDMDGVEELLSRELDNGIEETVLLCEGGCEPVPGVKNFTQTWKSAKGGKIMVPSHKYQTSYKGLMAWFYQLDKAGVTIVTTNHWIGSASALVAMYESSQDPKHKTLRRYVKDKIIIKSKNPHVLTLMGIKGGGIGEEIAKSLISRYGTAHYTMKQDISDLAETMVGDDDGVQKRMGICRAEKLVKAFGRPI